MNKTLKAVMVTAVVVAVGFVSGCGGGSPGPASGAGASTSTAAPAASPPAGSTPDGALLYASNCAGCHGALAVSSKKGITLGRLQTAIANNTGGMSFLSALTSAEQQAIVTALNPAAPVTTPAPTPTPTVDGVALYATNCAGCHGALATSSKLGVTLARLQAAISAGTGGMGSLASLSSAQQQAIVTALTPVTTTPTPTPTPVTDGATLYASDCASCHGALATSAKAGATVARIQGAINANTGSMGSLSSLTATQLTAIASALATATPPSTPPPATCGSCHALPPATGHHSKHISAGLVCATCHGSGYSTTTVNAATHNNGVVNLSTTIGWNTANRSCSNSCHGSRTW